MTSMQRYKEALSARSRHVLDPNERELQNNYLERAYNILFPSKKKQGKTAEPEAANNVFKKKNKKKKTTKKKKKTTKKANKKKKKKNNAFKKKNNNNNANGNGGGGSAASVLRSPTNFPTVSPQPSASPSISFAPTITPQPTFFPTISAGPTIIDCETGTDNFVGIIGSKRPVTALELVTVYEAEVNEEATVEDAVVIAEDVKESIADYLASELFPVCSSSSRSRQLETVSTSTFGTLDVERRLKTTGLYTLTEDAVVTGTCEAFGENTKCYTITDSIILLSNGQNDREKREDIEDARDEIERGMFYGDISSQFVPGGLALLDADTDNFSGSNNFGSNTVVRSGGNSNAVPIAVGASVGGLLFVCCLCVLAKLGMDKGKYENDDQASRNYNTQRLVSEDEKHYAMRGSSYAASGNGQMYRNSGGGGGGMEHMRQSGAPGGGMRESTGPTLKTNHPSGLTRDAAEAGGGGQLQLQRRREDEDEIERTSDPGSNTELESATDDDEHPASDRWM